MPKNCLVNVALPCLVGLDAVVLLWGYRHCLGWSKVESRAGVLSDRILLGTGMGAGLGNLLGIGAMAGGVGWSLVPR